MKTAWLLALFYVPALLFPGCTYTQVHYDEDQLRLGMVEFYRSQIMDNLIRASNGLPFVHVDLSNLQAAVQNKLAATVAFGQTLNDTGTKQTTVGGTLARGVVGVVTTASELAVRPFTASVNPERDNNITVTENPTFGDAADVYQTYAQFLNMTKPGGPLALRKYPWGFIDVSRKFTSIQSRDLTDPPRPGYYVEGTLTKWHNRYYFIPIEYKQAYFDLCFLIMAEPLVQTTPASQQKAILNQLKTNSSTLQQIQSQTLFNQ